MKDFRGTILAAATKQLAVPTPIALLVSIRVPTDPPTWFRITSYTDPVQRGVNSATGEPLVWSPFPVAVGSFTEGTKGDLRGTTINVGNATLEMMEQLELYEGLVGQKAIVRLVPATGPYEPAAERRYDGVIMPGVIVKQGVIVATIGQANLTKRPFPTHRFLSDHCGVDRFGGNRCGYSIPAGATNTVGGGFDFCSFTFGACVERGDDEVARGLPRLHPLRFDNCPGIHQQGDRR